MLSPFFFLLEQPMLKRLFTAALALAASMFGTVAHAQADPLPSWNDGPSEARIVAFVQVAYDRTSHIGKLARG
jgi:hypothetical protein